MNRVLAPVTSAKGATINGFWKRLRNRLFAPDPTPPDDTPRPAAPVPRPAPPAYFPATYTTPVLGDGRQPRVFDPALKHVRQAFRSGDPAFADEDTARRWCGLRQRAADHVLRAVAESPSGDRLVLHGSRLLKAWVGDAAREPGDLDFIFDPPSVGPEHADALFADLTAAVFERPAPPGVEFTRAAVAIDSIWTYERAEGRRIVFPWQAPGLPGGAIQLDVVFRESLAEPAQRISIPAADGGCVSVRAATPAQSLAWKLLWLVSDWYPQGKDLYDAVLLAERFALPRAVLSETFRLADNTQLPATAAALAVRDVDWTNFQREYPAVPGAEEEWLGRLTGALGPAFDPSAPVPAPERAPAVEPAWLTPTVEQLARGIDAGRDFAALPILADALQDAGCDDADLLGHLRQDGAHACGCWAVDLVLGRWRP